MQISTWRFLLLLLILPMITNQGQSQSKAHDRCEKLGRGMNFSFLEHFWKGDPELNFQNYLDLDQMDQIESEFEKMAALGVQTVRLPVCFEVWETEEEKFLTSIYFSILDDIVEWSSTLGLNLIIDFHHGNLRSEAIDADGNRLIAIWKIIAARYATTNPEKVFFDLYNEPHEISIFNYQRIMRRLMQELRKITPDHTFILGGLEFNNLQGLHDVELFADDNIIYAFHFYEPFLFTHQTTPWNGAPVMTAGLPFPYDEAAMPPMNAATKDTWGEFAWKKYAMEAQPEYLFYQLQHASSWSAVTGKPILCAEWGSYDQIKLDDRCRYTETMINIFEELSLPNIYWDWNQNFSLLENGSLPECMKEAWEPDPFFTTTTPTSNVVIHPNPASDFLQINMKDEESLVRINIYNAAGSEVAARNYVSDKVIIPIRGWSPGVYFLTCTDESGAKNDVKFIIQ